MGADSVSGSGSWADSGDSSNGGCSGGCSLGVLSSDLSESVVDTSTGFTSSSVIFLTLGLIVFTFSVVGCSLVARFLPSITASAMILQ